jgi:hypothetical protein
MIGKAHVLPHTSGPVTDRDPTLRMIFANNPSPISHRPTEPLRPHTNQARTSRDPRRLALAFFLPSPTAAARDLSPKP